MLKVSRLTFRDYVLIG